MRSGVSHHRGSSLRRVAACAVALLALPALAQTTQSEPPPQPEPQAQQPAPNGGGETVTTTEAVTMSDAPSYFAPGLTYMHPDSQRGTKYALGVSYAYGEHLSPRHAVELGIFGDTQETGIKGATDFYRYGANLDFLGYLGDVTGGHPFWEAGVAVVSNDVVPDNNDGVTASGMLGFGWRAAPFEHWDFRPRFDVRGVYDTFAGGQFDVVAAFTLEIPQERVKVITREKVIERVVEKEVVKEVPAAPPPDGDGDGVPDALDKCPDTVAGAKVDPDGCVRKEQVVVLPNIEFEYDKARLTGQGKAVLDTVVRFLKDQTEIQLDVWGHTDSKGADDYNQRLSQARAKAVVDYLVASGIDDARLTSAGFGESKPIADNDTDEGRARNRRVELHIRAAHSGEQP